MFGFFNKGAYDNAISKSILTGYTNTTLLKEYSGEKGYNSDFEVYYASLFRSETGVPDKHLSAINVPDKASFWYVPSYAEMSLILAQISTINNSLSVVNGDQITTNPHWTSSFRETSAKYHEVVFDKFIMSNTGSWYSGAMSYKDNLDVRVILAF